MQSVLWACVKDNWRTELITSLDASGKINGTVRVLIRRVIPVLPFTMMYAPRGPVCDIHDEAVIRELTEKIKKLAKSCRGYVLKIDPDVPSDDAEFNKIMIACGYNPPSNGKNFEGIQPRFVFRLNVEGKTEEDVFAAFHSKTRYNIRVAQKNGVTARLGTREDLPRFHEIMVETGLRDEFVTRNLEYFQKMYDVLAPTDNLRLYCAEHEGNIIAATLALAYGDKVWYLYGASSNASRNVMPNYLLQWEMIKWSLDRKAKIYDFRGVSGDLTEDNPLYGLYRFKKGFSGDLTEFAGEYELVLRPLTARTINWGTKIFMELRKKLFLLRNKPKGFENK